jgi:hypothetical protein
MTHTIAEPQPTTMDCIFENVLGFMLPFFLSSTGGDADLASDAIRELAEGYNVASPNELELVGRVLGFSTVAMDNLRLSMNPEMSDTKVLRYRSNAVALSRAGEQCRKILEVMQANRKLPPLPITIATPVIAAPVIPRPIIAAAPPPAQKPQPPQSAVKKPPAQPAAPRAPASPSRTGGVPLLPDDIETMKREARVILAAFSNKGGPSAQPAPSFPGIADPAALDEAIKQAFALSKPTAAA